MAHSDSQINKEVHLDFPTTRDPKDSLAMVDPRDSQTEEDPRGFLPTMDTPDSQIRITAFQPMDHLDFLSKEGLSKMTVRDFQGEMDLLDFKIKMHLHDSQIEMDLQDSLTKMDLRELQIEMDLPDFLIGMDLHDSLTERDLHGMDDTKAPISAFLHPLARQTPANRQHLHLKGQTGKFKCWFNVNLLSFLITFFPPHY